MFIFVPEYRQSKKKKLISESPITLGDFYK